MTFDESELNILKHNRTKRTLMLKVNAGIRDKVINETSFLNTSFISQRIWHILNETYSVPKCEVCGFDTKWDNTDNDYRSCCSVKCANASEKKKTAVKESNVSKYGVPCTLMDTAVQRKRKDSMFSRYGVEYAMENNELRDKQAESRKSNHADLLGVNCPELLCEIEVQDLADTYSYTEIADIYDKSYSWAQKLLKRYGFTAQYKLNGFEQEVSDYVESLGFNVVRNYKNNMGGMEIDLFLPDVNIGIECNGMYWHSEHMGRGKEYHLTKTLRGKENNIKIIHLWDHEWNYKTHVSKSYLRHLLKVDDKKIYARKCTVKMLDLCQAKEFLNSTHFQGYCKSSVKLGLFYMDELMSVMTFGKARYSDAEWELIRYSINNDISVVGGAGKLFKYFLNHYNPTSIVSYCDISKFDGQMYRLLGFEHARTSAPCYWYTKDYRTIEHRSLYQKHKLNKKLKNCDANLTEWQNMQIHGYSRIWDCGNNVYIYKH